jgi:hypothetical protein
MGVKRRVYYLVLATDDEVNFYSCIGADISIFIGCMTSTPDGSSPRGYSQIFYSSIGSEMFFFFQFFQYDLQKVFYLSNYFFLHYLLEVCAFSTPDGSSPRGYNGVLAADYRLKVFFFIFTIYSSKNTCNLL